MPSEDFDDSRARRLYGRQSRQKDYNPIIQSLGEVLVQVDDDDYEGDTRVLLRKDGRFGFLNFGWGSCDGCDALQGCSSYREIEELIRELESDIKWFDTLAKAQAYIGNDAEREGSYYYHKDEWQKFKAAVMALTDRRSVTQTEDLRCQQ